MYIGATDTIYLLMHWMMMELLKNRNVMTKLQKEVRDIVGSKFDITDEDLEKMHYLHAVIKETLRLHPPAKSSKTRCEANGISRRERYMGAY